MMAVDAEHNEHVVARHHGKALRPLEQTAEDVTSAPLPVDELPDELHSAGEADDQQIGQRHIQNDDVDTVATLLIGPQPEDDAGAPNDPSDDLYQQNKDSDVFVEVGVRYMRFDR